MGQVNPGPDFWRRFDDKVFIQAFGDDIPALKELDDCDLG